jgi:hypothetical protein
MVSFPHKPKPADVFAQITGKEANSSSTGAGGKRHSFVFQNSRHFRLLSAKETRDQ